jgi:hypothetical protein
MSLPCAHESGLSVSEGWSSGQPHSHCVWSYSLFIILIVDATVMADLMKATKEQGQSLLLVEV